MARRSLAAAGQCHRGARPYRSGPDADSLTPVAWARVTLTRPSDPLAAADFDNETVVGWAHGDDRGEFLAVLGSKLLPGGAALPASVTVRLWVFLPPAGGSDNAFDQLPIEIAGSDLHNAVLAGTAAPPGYVRQAAVTRVLSPGEVSTIHDDALDYITKRAACLWRGSIDVDGSGQVAVPDGPGLGYEPDRDVMERYRVS